MFKFNPKLKDSGIIECIPQKGNCPVGCTDCFYNGGRSYLEPLNDNTPHIPTMEQSKGRVVRFNDGNDSNVERSYVEHIAERYQDKFFNTSIPHELGLFSAPVVLTLNPSKMTDVDFHKLPIIPKNLMMVRIRTNVWNLESVVIPAINYYTSRNVMCVLTFMAYYETPVPEQYKINYEWKQRTTNSYWCLKAYIIKLVMKMFEDNPYVDSCTRKGQYSCRFCSVCLREYYATKERMKNET